MFGTSVWNLLDFWNFELWTLKIVRTPLHLFYPGFFAPRRWGKWHSERTCFILCVCVCKTLGVTGSLSVFQAGEGWAFWKSPLNEDTSSLL